MAQRSLLLSGGTRWALAATLVVATGWAAFSHVVRAKYRKLDAATIVLGTAPTALAARFFEAKGGLALRLSDAERIALLGRIASKPLDSNAFAMLALDATAQGDAAHAEQLVTHAIALEPRTRLAWLWRLDRQMRSRRMVDAATSALRLLAVDPAQYRVYLPLLAQLSKDRRNIAQIAVALRGNPGWREPFLNTLQTGGFDPSIRYALMDPGGATVYTQSREQTSFVSDLITKGDYERAYLAWVSYLPDSALAGVDIPYDSRFAGLPGAAPFNWVFAAAEGDRATPGRGGLDLSYSGRKPTTLASQVTVLQPGGYRLRSTITDARTEGPPASGTTLTWNVHCLPGNELLGNVALDPAVEGRPQFSAPFRVPDQGCAAVLLTLDGTAAEFPVRLNARIAAVRFESATVAASQQPAPEPTPSSSAIPAPQSPVLP